MDFKTFFEQNKKACVGGLAGAVAVLMGLVAVTGNKSASIETTAATAESAENKEETTAAAEPVSNNFYAKLTHSQPVSVLVLGDGFAKGSNLENISTSWSELIIDKLQTEFSAEVSFDNYALPSDSTVYSGYVMANEIPEGAEYDAVILCFGEYDDPETFGTFYEGIIRNLINKCPEISVISLIEPSSATNPEGFADDNASQVKNITDHYNGLTIDIPKLMEENGGNAKDTADSDNINQNDDGNAKTADIILSAVKNFASGAAENDYSSISALDEKTESLLNYTYISASDFVKVNDTTYELPADMILDVYGNTVSGLLGVDYDYQPGTNDVYVSVDGTPFGRSTGEFGGEAPEQRILLINDNFEPAQFVTVSFGTAQEAESFAGIIVSGNVALPDSYDSFEAKEIQELNMDQLSELIDSDEEDEPDSEEAEEPDEPENNGPSNGDTKTEDGLLYEYYNGEWFEVINDDTGNPNIGVKQEVVETRSAGQIITNKETAHSSSSAAAQETQETTTEAVQETSAAIPETNPVETAAETVAPETEAPETAAAELPVENADTSAYTDPNAAALPGQQ